jgi:hypothetical protein
VEKDYKLENTICSRHFLSTDQPQTCPHCGLRTEILADLSHTTSQIQIHQCLNERCGFQFIASFEEEQELCPTEEPEEPGVRV